jgi:DNA-binding CsgD family transcriptional regulator
METTLSKTEHEVMKYFMTGESRKGIAEKMYRSDLTIKTHFQNIFRKMECKSEVELVIKYIKKYYGVIFVLFGFGIGWIFRVEIKEIVEYLKACINGF